VNLKYQFFMKMVFRQNTVTPSLTVQSKSISPTPNPIKSTSPIIGWNMIDRVLSGKPCVACPRK